MKIEKNNWLQNRIRGFLPVVVDVETSGVNPIKNSILSIGAIILNEQNKQYQNFYCYYEESKPFNGSQIQSHALKINGLDAFNQESNNRSEKDVIKSFMNMVQHYVTQFGCSQAILVGHNAHFDLSFIQLACYRHKIKHNPFHRFSVIDTVGLAAAFCGQTILAKAFYKFDIEFNNEFAHHAGYDAYKTAELFCKIFNYADNLYKQIPNADENNQ